MNQRTTELYQQALEFAYNKVPKENWSADILHPIVSGKFAELIIQECASRVRDTDLEDVEGGDSAVLNAAAKQLKQHFGVE
jgi:hypothetical protein